MRQKVFEVDKEVEHITNWIKEYFLNNGSDTTKAVIGISGGKDSTIAAALLVRALGPSRVVGVRMPQGKQHDIDDAKQVCDLLKIPSFKSILQTPVQICIVRLMRDMIMTICALLIREWLLTLPPVSA